jgi:PAS domain S-box-containing protein
MSTNANEQKIRKLTQALKSLKPHDHLCLIYESHEEWRDAVISFIKIGLKKGEKCVYIVDAHTAEQVRQYLHEEGVDVTEKEASGQLVILHETEAYTRKGSFDPDRMIQLLITETKKALKEGYPALRVTGEMTWVLKGLPGYDKILEYEAKMNRDLFPKYPCLAICQYERWKFDPEIIKGVVMTHPLLIRGYHVYRNFYYIPPEEFLNKKRAEREVQHLLNNIERERDVQERQQFFANIIEYSSQPIASREPDGYLRFWNTAFCNLLGYSDEELSIMKRSKELIPPEWREQETKMLEQLRTTRQPVRYEKEYIRKDGSRVPVELLVEGVFDSEGNVDYYMSFITDITERKQAEKTLQASEETLWALINATRETLLLIDKEGTILVANEVVAQRLGKSSQELIGTCLYDRFPPDIAKSRKEHFDKVAITGESIRFEDTRAGRFYEIYCYPVFNEEGKVSRLVIFASDITERKRAEKQLHNEKERFFTISENAPFGMIMIDKDGNFIYVNSKFKEIFGYDLNDIPDGRTWFHKAYPDPEYRYTVVSAWIDDLKERKVGEKRPREFIVTCKDGTKKIIELISVQLETGEYITSCEDITFRKQAEDALGQSEEKYRSIFENSVEGIYQSTLEGQFISTNPAMARMHGYESPEEMITSITNIGEQLYVDPKERKRYKNLLEEHGIVEDFESQFYRKDGTIIWVSLSTRAVKDATGKVLYYEGTVEDTTLRKQAEEELKQTMEKLRKTLAGTIQAMSLTVETRDPYTSGHQKRVSNLARVIAQEMGLSKDITDSIRMAGIIHDIGKISVPAEILSKPTKLSNMEFGLIKVHPQTAYDILKEVELPYPIAKTVLQHHERLDGSGYPQGLKGENIILEARILAVADVVEAMASHRPYRPALGIDTALAEIEKNKGVLYDEKAVEVCVKLFQEKGFRFE